MPDALQPLLLTIGVDEHSVKEIMEAMGLKSRVNFMSLYLAPAIKQGLVRMRYPDNLRHPRQKYLLSVKGLAWYNERSAQK